MVFIKKKLHGLLEEPNPLHKENLYKSDLRKFRCFCVLVYIWTCKLVSKPLTREREHYEQKALCLQKDKMQKLCYPLENILTKALLKNSIHNSTKRRLAGAISYFKKYFLCHNFLISKHHIICFREWLRKKKKHKLSTFGGKRGGGPWRWINKGGG